MMGRVDYRVNYSHTHTHTHTLTGVDSSKNDYVFGNSVKMKRFLRSSEGPG